MPSIYERIRGTAPLRQQELVQNRPYQTQAPQQDSQMNEYDDAPQVQQFSGMMEQPSALQKHVETNEKAEQFSSFVDQKPELKMAMDKVQQFAMQLRENQPNISQEEAQQAVQLYIAKEFA